MRKKFSAVLALSTAAISVFLSGCAHVDASIPDGEQKSITELPPVTETNDELKPSYVTDTDNVLLPTFETDVVERLAEPAAISMDESSETDEVDNETDEDESDIDDDEDSDEDDEFTEYYRPAEGTNPYAEIADVLPLQKYDPVIVNEDIQKAIKANKPEEADPGDYYFTYYDFDKVYSNEELIKCFDRLQEICNSAYYQLGFSYMNIETGAYVGYGQYSSFMTCSTIKAPFVKSLLADDVDLDTVISRTYQWDGDYGTIACSGYGTNFTAKELMEYAIKESDNTAYYMLCNYFGPWAFNNMQYELGAGYTLGSWIFTNCTSDDMMKDYVDIYNFANENENGRWLVDMLCNCDLNMQIGQALGGKYKVAQKYGSEFTDVYFNDCAIVYADSPFVLCIFTRQPPETEESAQVFKELAVVFDDINSLICK